MDVHPVHQVLVVDDNDDVRNTQAEMLRLEGFAVVGAWSGEDRLRHFRQGYRPCVVLLDLHMPGMDGWAFHDRMLLEPDLATIPVVIVSGYPNEAARARERGACQFITKPAGPVELIRAVERHCQRRRAS